MNIRNKQTPLCNLLKCDKDVFSVGGFCTAKSDARYRCGQTRICGGKMVIREYNDFKEDEIHRLYAEVGWTAYTENMTALEQGYKNSLLVLAAYDNEELLGIIRVVGDDYTIIWIQDIVVSPARQRQGIGTSLLKAVLCKYSDVRQIELATDNTPETIAFYKSLGFSEFSDIGCCGFMRC